MNNIFAQQIAGGETFLGIELGSTRIKAVLIGKNHEPLASGGHSWENRLQDGLWTYTLDDIWCGISACYKNLADQVFEKYGVKLETVGAIGISAMMHGYLACDSGGNLLTPFRTWRNTNTAKAAAALTSRFNFNIPLRWSIAHLEQAILDGEEHTAEIKNLTTLAGYIHWKLTGKFVLGVGDASGMFPIDSKTCTYDAAMLASYNETLKARGLPFVMEDILPIVLLAGETAGFLTADGAKLLDPAGTLKSGIPLCPPEGDAGTGMVATNSVAPKTGNVSAGTSAFAMIVLENALGALHEEIDMVTTPAGAPVAMSHCNTCTSDIDAWVSMFGQFLETTGTSISTPEKYDLLYNASLEADPDCGGVLSYNFYSGEPSLRLETGRPLLVRTPDCRWTLPNFMRAQLYSALCGLKPGLDILFDKENVELRSIIGHGGFFKTPKVGQQIAAAVFGVPVSVMETAGEGGAWGMALLAAYSVMGKNRALNDYLETEVFHSFPCVTVEPKTEDIAGFGAYYKSFTAVLDAERAAAALI